MDLKEYRNGHTDIYGTFDIFFCLYLNIKKEISLDILQNISFCVVQKKERNWIHEYLGTLGPICLYINSLTTLLN